MAIQLRPLGFGEMLDQTFNIYRRNFGLFLGVSILPPIVALLVAAAVAVLAVFGIGMATLKDIDHLSITVIAGLAVVGVVLLLIYYTTMVLSQAASIRAVSEVYLGRQTTISESFSSAFRRLGPLLLITISVTLIAFLPMIVPAALGVTAFFMGKADNTAAAVILGIVAFLTLMAAWVYMVFIVLRYLLAIPSCVIENRTTAEALHRSAFLMKGNYFRALGILVLIGLLGALIAWALQIPTVILSLLLAKTSVPWLGTVVSQLVQFAASAFIAPLGTIAHALIYYDARIRKEAFDIELMMREADGEVPQNQTPAPNFG